MCGRDNPSHLIFCQECGQRLAPRASPTVPAEAAPATSPLAATTSAPIAPASAPLPLAPPSSLHVPPPSAAAAATAPAKPRPAAPEVSFTRRGEGPPPVESSMPLERSGAVEAVSCSLCGTANQRGLRFCIACGQLLVSADDAADRIGAIELMRTVEAHRPEASGPASAPAAAAALASAPAAMPIAPARVIEVGPPTPRLGERFCPRCRGACEPTAQFCRFCGLSLAAATPTRTPTAAAATGTVIAPPRSTAGAPTARPARVAPPPAAHLVLIARDGSEGSTYPLSELVDLGRVEGDILFSDDPYVSPRHARITCRDGTFFLRDLESTNGVFVRIPFAVAADGPSDQDARPDDRITMRGHHGSDALGDARSEQSLSDQELFLVGQQVLKFEVVKQAEEGFGAASENGTLLFGTPAAPRYARLSQRTVEGLVRDVFHLRKAETVIGRESGDIVFTDDPFLSRRHAAVRMRGGPGQPKAFTLTDLGSSNGTFLRIRNEVRLHAGDHFRIGQQLLRFDIDAARAGV